MRSNVCYWVEEREEDGSPYWRTLCGVNLLVWDGDLDPDYKYCPGCGGSIVVTEAGYE